MRNFALGEPLTADRRTDPQHFRVANELYQAVLDLTALNSQMEGVERLIEVYTPLLTPELVDGAASISSLFADQTRKFRYLASFLRGTATKDERLQATMARIDVAKIISLYDDMAKNDGLYEVTAKIKMGRDAIVEPYTQHNYVSAITKILTPILYPGNASEKVAS
jgi:hypothetical protein